MATEWVVCGQRCNDEPCRHVRECFLRRHSKSLSMADEKTKAVLPERSKIARIVTAANAELDDNVEAIGRRLDQAN